MSTAVMLEREGAMESIRRAIAESEIPEENKCLLCSPRLMRWIVHTLGMRGPADMRRELGAELIGVGYLEDRKIIVTDRETAERIAPASVQAARA